MNPDSLRAGKAIEQTGQSLHPPETPDHANPASAKIPPILFEGDQSTKFAETAPAQKFALGVLPKADIPKQPEPKLPDAYGTGNLLLAARDPHNLFAHWDLTKEQQHHYNSLSADGHLTLRAYAHAYSNQPAAEVAVDAESRHLFLNVERAATSYVGELGYYQSDQTWKTIATSAPATTPPDSPSQDSSVTFSTPQPRTGKPAVAESPQSAIIPVSTLRWPFESEASTEDGPIPPPGIDLQEADDAPPFVKRGARKKWSTRQEQLLAEMIRVSLERREWLSSAEIARLIEHNVELPAEIPSPVLPGALVNISSPMGEQPGPRGFWFNVNAELIIYGATEPSAQVTIAGQPIHLRPDGTFSCHFALPDGDYAVTAIALSPENEQRQAAMNFSRHTNYSSDAGAHPQNLSLGPLPRRE